jgi:hypothetical protein
VLDHPPAEGDRTLHGRSTGAERRLAADDLVLELALALVEQGVHQAAAVAEAAEERALADARRGGDRVHRHMLDSPLLDQASRSREDPQAVARRVGALAELRPCDGQGQRRGAGKLGRRGRHGPDDSRNGPWSG